MLRLLLLPPTLVLLTLGLFTVVPVPAWAPWQFAVLAGEFGHAGALLSLVIAGVAGVARRLAPRIAGAVIAANLGAAGLLLVPCVTAFRIRDALPARLVAAFGPAAIERKPFSLPALLGRDPEPMVIETLMVRGDLPLDFYRPARRDQRPAPCVVVVHGGGWNAGDRQQLPQFNHWLAQRGYAVAAISYRLAPEHRWPAQRDDTLAALRFLAARAGELGIDATRLVLLGRSAGGQIAQTVGYTAHDAGIRGVVALYAPSDLIFGYVNTHENDAIQSPALMRQYLGGTPATAAANYRSASALFRVDRAAPPTLLLHGENDTLVWHRHSVRLAARLEAHGVPCVFVSLPWAAHAFDYTLHGPGGQIATFALEWFLARVTR